MQKTEYAEYLRGEKWRERRSQFLMAYDQCGCCGLPRDLAIVAYDQDLHVHHKSYARIGGELEEDLAALCKRCHEIKHFGHSGLHQPRRYMCANCGEPTFFRYLNGFCEPCFYFFLGPQNDKQLEFFESNVPFLNRTKG